MPSKDQIADALLEHKHVGRAAEGLGLGERNRARLRVPNGTRCCWRNYEQQTQAQYNGTQHFHKASSFLLRLMEAGEVPDTM